MLDQRLTRKAALTSSLARESLATRVVAAGGFDSPSLFGLHVGTSDAYGTATG